MLTIQEAGNQILTGNPGKFYVFTGLEYGIKEKYIQSLIAHYEGNIKEVESVKTVLDLMGKKHLIPLTPVVYVVRYDEEFVSALSQTSQPEIDSAKIVGTVVCLYEASKQAAKCEKYLPNYTVAFTGVEKKFLYSYLKKDFPELSDNFIKFALQYRDDYKSAWNICNALSYSNKKVISENDLSLAFNCKNLVSETQFKQGIAARNYKYCKNIIEEYPDALEGLFYSILNAVLELDKITDNKYAQSELRSYANNWSKSDIYYMFMNTYEELKKSRNYSSYDIKSGLLYLISLLPFKSILPTEVLE